MTYVKQTARQRKGPRKVWTAEELRDLAIGHRHELVQAAVRAATPVAGRPLMTTITALPSAKPGAVVLWWPELAPLKPFERLLVRQGLGLEVR